MEQKKKPESNRCWRFVFGALSACAAWELLWVVAGWLIAEVFGGISFNVTKASTIGIIGGADGPTSVFIAASYGSVWELLLWTVLLIIGIRGFRYFGKSSKE